MSMDDGSFARGGVNPEPDNRGAVVGETGVEIVMPLDGPHLEQIRRALK